MVAYAPASKFSNLRAVSVGRSRSSPGDEAVLLRALLRGQLGDPGVLGDNPRLGDPAGDRAGGVPGASAFLALATLSLWCVDTWCCDNVRA